MTDTTQDQTTQDQTTQDSADGAPVDIPAKATPLQAGKAVKMPAALGATFAERKKAREAREKAIQAAENKAVKAADKK